jgi:nitrogen fixation NifU-like protein
MDYLMPYEDYVLKHFGEPYHKGPMPNDSIEVYQGCAESVVCGDMVIIRARIEDGVITEVWWQGDGCCFSQAAASMLAEFTRGKTVDDMRDYHENEMFRLFRAKCVDARRGCVLVALEALQNLLENEL